MSAAGILERYNNRGTLTWFTNERPSGASGCGWLDRSSPCPAMPRLQRKSLHNPDQIRRFANGRMDIVTLDEMAVGRFVFQPGWRWSKDVQPVVGTNSCQLRHTGYTVAGSLVVRMDDGTEL